jgi:glycosyltransferase involved in cell wall biosynthesis
MDRSRVAIIIPAFNEEKTISKVVEGANKYGQSIVIDDGSKDKTAIIAKKSGAIVVIHKKNLGYDAALNTGFKKAAKLNFDFIITLDADGQHKTELIKKFIKLLDSGASIVLGVRNKKTRFAEHLFSFYTRYRYNIIDPLCGLKGYRLESYKLFGYFDKFKSIGTELMLRNISLGKPFKQVHFNVRNRSGKPKFGNSISGNVKIFRSLFFCMIKIP